MKTLNKYNINNTYQIFLHNFGLLNLPYQQMTDPTP